MGSLSLIFVGRALTYSTRKEKPNRRLTVKAREKEIVCKVRTQQAENFDEEVKSLVSAWFCLQSSSLFFSFIRRRLKTEQPQAETKTQCAGAKTMWVVYRRRLSFLFSCDAAVDRRPLL